MDLGNDFSPLDRLVATASVEKVGERVWKSRVYSAPANARITNKRNKDYKARTRPSHGSRKNI